MEEGRSAHSTGTARSLEWDGALTRVGRGAHSRGGSGLLGGGLLRRPGRRLLRGPLRRLLHDALAGRRALGALLGEQLVTALRRDRLGVVVLAQRRVGLAVGDVGAEPAVLDDDGLA